VSLRPQFCGYLTGGLFRALRGRIFAYHITATDGRQPMADKADQALKLAQKVEKDLKALQDHVKKVEQGLLDAINVRSQKMTDLHNEQDKRLTDSHNKQEAKFTELHNEQNKRISAVVAWAAKTFDTKGWF
jgi:Skp family chaperone for outer membrane proteins